MGLYKPLGQVFPPLVPVYSLLVVMALSRFVTEWVYSCLIFVSDCNGTSEGTG